MPCLVKRFPDDIVIAENFVHAPGYSLIVANMNENSPVTDGWKYYSATLTRDAFPPLWHQPEGAHDAYDKGATVYYNGKVWESTILANVWAPGVSGWKEVQQEDTTAPSWIQPTGAHDAYSAGAIVQHSGQYWKSTLDANVWEPGVYGWTVFSNVPPDAAPAGLPAWVQPTGAHDAYALGAQVSHNGHNWQSTVGSNVWEPGVYGWTML